MATIITRAGKGSPLTHNEVDANFTNLNTDKIEASDLTAGTGISIAGTTITNAAPDQTVVLTQGANVTITGTYPNFTIASTDTNTTYTAGSGLQLVGTEFSNTAPDQTVVLTAGTGISTSGTYPNFTITNTAPDQTVVLTQGANVTITGTYPSFTIASSDQFTGTVTSVGGTGTVNGLSLSGTVTSSGNLTLGGTLSISDADWSGTDLSVANGGTGASSFTANNVLLGNGTSAFQTVAPGTSGNVLTSNGTTWTSATPTASAPSTAQVLEATAGATAGDVGTYMFAGENTSSGYFFGDTIAGSSLRPAGIESSGTWSTTNRSIEGTAESSGVSGTWMCMGTASRQNSRYYGTLWLRIS